MNDHKDLNNGNSQSEDESKKDKIPLWLQGLEESEDNSVNHVEGKSSFDDSWVKEIDPNDEHLDSNKDAHVQANKEIQLPEWIRENPDYETEKTGNRDLEEEPAQNIQDDFAKEIISEGDLTSENGFPNDKPSTEGFIDISELDTEKHRESVQFIPIEEDDISEELPEWLHDMITDHPEETSLPSVFNDVDQTDENEEFILVDQESLDLEPKEEPWQEITSVEEQDQMDQVSITSTKPSLELFNDDVTKPVKIEPKYYEMKIEEDFESTPDIGETSLERTKTLLDQNDIPSAIELFRQHLEQEPTQDDLETMLNSIETYMDNNVVDNCELLELKGDVALKKNEPEQAFLAYSQALKTLLSNNEVNDETS
jgi:hypothetical protein